MKCLFQEIYTFFEHAGLKEYDRFSVGISPFQYFYYTILSTKYHMIDLEVFSWSSLL